MMGSLVSFISFDGERLDTFPLVIMRVYEEGESFMICLRWFNCVVKIEIGLCESMIC